MLTRSVRWLALFAGVATGSALFGRALPAAATDSAKAMPTDHAAARALFHDTGCEFCHGVNGVGGEKGPSLAGVGRRLKPEAIRTQILAGGGGMPAFADALNPEQTATLVDWLKSRRERTPKAKRKGGTTPATAPGGGSDDQ